MTNQLITVAQPQVFVQNGTVYTNTINVANIFCKRPDNVNRSIRRLLKSVEPGHFIETRYVEQHRTRASTYTGYNMTRMGFTLLAMGFTGDKALEFKLRYIAAFEAMEQRLGNTPIRPPSGAQMREVRRALEHFASLSPASEQAFAVALYSAIGIKLPEPVIPTAKFYTTTELAERHGLAPSNFGKLPAVKALKVAAHGETRLTTTSHGKQVAQFYWSQTGADAVDAVLRSPHLRLLD